MESVNNPKHVVFVVSQHLFKELENIYEDTQTIYPESKEHSHRCMLKKEIKDRIRKGRGGE